MSPSPARALARPVRFMPFSSRSGHPVDLGLEPPIARDGERGSHDRRTISLRWLAGTVLTGLFGAALIGSAIYIALDGELTFAERAEQASAPAGRVASADKSPKRGDKLFVSADIVSAKQAFRTPTTIRVGDREVIKVKPFVRVATNLALGSLGFAEDIPAFNPMKMYNSGNDTAERAPEPETNEGDAEVSVQKRLLMGYTGAPDSGAMLTQSQVEAQIAEERKATLFVGQRPNLPLNSQLMLTHALNASAMQPDAPPASLGTSFSTMQVTFSTENVTIKEKTPRPERQLAPTTEEKLVTIRRNENFEQVLRANGAGPNEGRSIVSALATRLSDAPVREGSRLKLLFGLSADGKRSMQLLRVIVLDGETVTAIAAVDDRNTFRVGGPAPGRESRQRRRGRGDRRGQWRPAALRQYLRDRVQARHSAARSSTRSSRSRSTISICSEGYRAAIPSRSSTPRTMRTTRRPDVLYASLSVGGLAKHYYRFQTGDDGIVDFFDETGKSNRKFLIRKPISDGILRSTFGMRYHPILRYSRMHTGHRLGQQGRHADHRSRRRARPVRGLGIRLWPADRDRARL